MHITRDICLTPHGEKCTRGAGLSLGLFVVLVLVALVLVYGAVFIRRENVRLWRNVGSGTAEAPAAMGNWISMNAGMGGAYGVGMR